MNTAALNDSPATPWTPPDNTWKYRYMKVPKLGPLESVDCAFCGPVQTERVCTQGWFGEDFNVVRCPKCSLIYTNPRPTAQWKAHYYDPQYNGFIEAQGRDFLYSQEDNRVAGYHRLIRFLKKRIAHGATLLDGGCAAGRFVKLAKDAGFNAKGCDYSERAVSYGKEHYGVEIIPSPIENVDAPDNSFDVVTLLHVFEHLPEPHHVLQEIKRILKPGGLLLLETVNYLPHYYIEKYFRFLIPIYNRLTGREGLPWVPFDHLYHWSPRAMFSAFRQAGFVDCDHHFLAGYRSEGIPGPVFGLIYNGCGLIGGGLRLLSAGRWDFWPVLLTTARKPLNP